MTSSSPLPFAAEVDENADTFDSWLVKQSCALLVPICRLGLAIVALFLLLADPVALYLDVSEGSAAHTHLIAWHIATAAYLGLVLRLEAKAQTTAAQHRLLLMFVCVTSVLFIWFGVASWLDTGDLCMVAVAQILVASVLRLPGSLRRWTYCLQAAAISALLAWLDTSGGFLSRMQFINLAAAAFVAHVIDSCMLKNARTLFREKCQVALERQRADAVLFNTIPPEIAQELKVHYRVQAQNYPTMAILFADIVGFTEFASKRAPDQVLAILNPLFNELDTLIDSDQVEKIKTMGDAYMVVSKAHPEALARLALSMRAAVQRFNHQQGLQLALRLGLHCGPAIAGVIGHKRFMYDVWGDAVNLASRMQSSSEPGCIHTSESFFRRLQHAFEFEPRGLVAIKGKGLLQTYFLLDVKCADPVARQSAVRDT